MPEFIAGLNTENDKLASQWGPGGLRAPTRTYWGWNAKGAARIAIPTLVLAGEQDGLHKSNTELFDDLGADKNVFVSVACATHCMNWERQRRILHRASLQWLSDTAIEGKSSGRFKADPDGHITVAP
jgi:pimeloyl-ACP methyl ester carboxylesterase